MSAQIIYPPQHWENPQKKLVVFLAGSIEMGKASPWQEHIGNKLADFDIIILNPRRADWDSTWLQKATNQAFKQQVTWELTGIETADIVVFHLEGGTLSPVSMLELGLVADKNKAVLHCDADFWRKGNVDIVCQKYNIPQVADIEGLVDYVKNKILL